jgi:hypothetical protein
MNGFPLLSIKLEETPRAEVGAFVLPFCGTENNIDSFKTFKHFTFENTERQK